MFKERQKNIKTHLRGQKMKMLSNVTERQEGSKSGLINVKTGEHVTHFLWEEERRFQAGEVAQAMP